MLARGSPGEKVWVNLQMGAGARNVLHQPPVTRFDQGVLNTLILTVV